MISLLSLIGYLCYELCSPPKQEYQRMDSSTDEVSDLPSATYGSAQAGNGTIPVTGPRVRKYSESVGRSYVASAVARYELIINASYIPTHPCQVNVSLKTNRIHVCWTRSWKSRSKTRRS